MSGFGEGAKEFALALIKAVPAIAPEVMKFAGASGLDLGPAPPDMRADFARVDAEFAAELARKKHG